MTFGGGPTGGYIIDYTTIPRAVFRWRRHMLGQDVVITPLPDGARLLYRTLPLYTPEEHVCEFTVEEVLAMNLHELDFYIASDLYEDIWGRCPKRDPSRVPC